MIRCAPRRAAAPVSVFVLAALAGHAPADPGDQLDKVLPDDGVAQMLFGESIGVHAGVAIVGAKGSIGFMVPGAAYLFDVATGAQLVKFSIPASPQERQLVNAVAIGPGVALIGTNIDGQPGYDQSVRIFDITDPENPTLIDRVTPDDAVLDDGFGDAIAVSGSRALIGAYADDDNGGLSGSAYIFDTATGAQLGKLLADDGAMLDRFGEAVDLDADMAIVGAVGDDDNGDAAGAAYLFDVSDPANPVQLAKLLADDSAPGDSFGFSVAVSGNLAVVGAISNDENGSNAGAAYVFDISTPTAPVQTAKILADAADPDADDFGWAVALDGVIALVSARTDDDVAAGAGAAYLYDLSNPASPAQIDKLVADDSDANDVFGWSAALDAGVAVVGASQDEAQGLNAGSAYLFDASPPPAGCNEADLAEPVGVLDFSDVLAFLTAFGAMDADADLADPTGVFDFSDVIAFLTAFGAGCP